MSSITLMKYTYHRPNSKNFHSYLKMPSPTFSVLKRELMMSLFEQHDQEYAELRVYWIDDDLDEIEIVNQNDYEVFVLKRPNSQHLHVAPVFTEEKISADTAAEVEGQKESLCQTVHSTIECDSCLAFPIVGFRYKCLSCPNYDLCQACEAKHHHPEHIMIRLPYVSPNHEFSLRGRCGGRRHKRMSSGCPLMTRSIPVPAENAPNSSEPTDGGKERHHRRKIREYRNSFFSNLYNIMQDLAEGGTNVQAKDENAEKTGKGGEKPSNTDKNESTSMAKESPELAENVSKINADVKIANAAAAFAENAANIAQKNAELAKKAVEAAIGTGFAPIIDIDALAAEAKKNPLEIKENSTEYVKRTFAPVVNNSNDQNKKPEEENNAEAKSSAETKPNGTAVHPEIDLSNINLEQVSQMVGPQLMKTGFEVLNNLSEMFAKLLDPTGEPDPNIAASVLGSLSSLSPDSSSESRKNSVASQFSAVSQNSMTQTDNLEKVAAVEIPITSASTVTSSDNSVNVESLENISGLRRSPSDDNDWQIIDKQQAGATAAPEAAAISINASTEGKLQADSMGTPQVPKLVDTEKPIDNMERAITDDKQEQPKTNTTEKKDTESAVESSVHPAPYQPAYASPYAQLASDVGVDMASQGISANSTGAIPKISDASPVVYHQNPKINQAVIAMMAMGFSNEGAWLTQLLDSVDGNIAVALDLMSTAQRKSN